MNNHPLLPSIFLTAMSALLLSACETPMNTVSIFGDPAPATAATKTIEITPETEYINVTEGDTVNFVVNGKSFAWDFDGRVEGYAFDLQRVAPPGLLDHKVEAYVRPNSDYLGGA
jgi:hypothetical protein